MKSWMVLVGFCVVTVTVGVLVGLGKIPQEYLASVVTGFLGMLVKNPFGEELPPHA